jgi:hypothetical protein
MPELWIAAIDPNNYDRPINPCNNWWLSPDVYLDNGSIDAGTAQEAVKCRVNVKVHNLSTQPINNVTAQAWVCDFTAGVGPSSGRPSFGGTGGMSAFIPQIGTGGQNSHLFQWDWTPDNSDVQTNGGHICFLANCYGDAPDTGQTVTTLVTDFCTNAHHAQRNIAVRAVSGGQRRANFPFHLANPDLRRERELVATIHEVRGRFALAGVARSQLLSGPHAELTTVGNRQRVVLASRHVEKPIPLTLAQTRPRINLDGDGDGDGKPRGVIRRVLRPQESVPVSMQVEFSPREQPGSAHVFDVRSTSNGQVVGGVRVIFVLTP